MSVVVGTAGHIDHGKTALLRALTGIDADRLPEERRRGMTIDVGYAHLELADGDVLDFVDVPGHDRLVGNMLVGAGEVDAAMLVVAADDGPRAQTMEHLHLLDALGLRRGLGVVTKLDLVDARRLAEVVAEVREIVGRTRLVGAPVVAVSSVTGEGIPDLRAELTRLRDAVRADLATMSGSGGPRLAVDRAFSVRGFGAVVTGTLRGGHVAVGDRLRLLPGDLSVRVRGIQVRSARVEGASDGRTALNLTGVEVAALHRGMVLTGGSDIVASRRFLVVLERPTAPRIGHDRWAAGDEARWPPADRSRARMSLGTDQADVAIGRSGRDGVSLPDGRVVATLRLDREVAVAAGDRFVLRRPSPGSLVAGGVVLDPLPAAGAGRRRQTPERVATLAAAIELGDPSSATAALTDLRGVRVPQEGAVPAAAADVRGAVAAAVLEAVTTHHRGHPTDPGVAITAVRSVARAAVRRMASVPGDVALHVAASAVDDLVGSGGLVRDGEHVRLPDHRPPSRDPQLEAAMDRLEALLAVPAPPDLAEAVRAAGCTPADVRVLQRAGRLVVLAPDLAYATAAFSELSTLALEMARRSPLTPAAFRDETGTSRKYVMAILEELGRRGVLARTPDGHVPGPRSAGDPSG